MPSGLMQIVAYGAQDIYLVGNPEVTYFKAVYRRHTNFSMESIENTFSITPRFGEKISATISRNGDLMSKIYIQALLPDITEKGLPDFGITPDGFNLPSRRYTRWVDNVGHYLIKWVEIEIGGQVIDRHYSDWLEIWAQLTVPASKMEGYRTMIGQDAYNVFGQNTGLQADVLRATHPQTLPTHFPAYNGTPDNILVGREIYVPLQFWFCRDYGMALPLIALQHHEVKINIEFRDITDLIISYTGELANEAPGWNNTEPVIHNPIEVSLWVDYIFLDGDERRKFAQVAHEYLIEQTALQRETVVPGTDQNPSYNKIDMHFEHPVKELVWVCKGFESNKEWCNFTNTGMRIRPPMDTVNIVGGTLQSGLAGLPNGKLDPDQINTIEVYYSNMNPVPAGTALTVVGNQNDVNDDTKIFFVPHGIRFHVGDLVVITDGTDLVELLVLTADIGSGAPLQFTTIDQNNVTGTDFDIVTVVDRIGSNVTVDNGTISGMSGAALSNITTLTGLLDFASYNSSRPYDGISLANNPVCYANIQLNRYDLTGIRHGSYFNRYQPMRHHHGIPISPGVNVYSFALKPEDQQPSGSCNFSRLDTARLQLWIGGLRRSGGEEDVPTTMSVSVYARNYNVLRIMSGMAGLAYA
jgi:hypothetical protein